MSEQFEPYVWGDEDGENWFADAHLDHAEMLIRAKAHEEECGTLEDSQLHLASIESTVCGQFYAKSDPDDEERWLPCMPRAEGASPMTQLYMKASPHPEGSGS